MSVAAILNKEENGGTKTNRGDYYVIAGSTCPEPKKLLRYNTVG